MVLKCPLSSSACAAFSRIRLMVCSRASIWLGVEVLGEVSAQELKKALLELDPGIVVGEWEGHNGVTVNTLSMEPDEVRPLVEGMIGCYESLAKGGAQE